MHTKFEKMNAKEISGDLQTLETVYDLDIDEWELQFINWHEFYVDEGFRSSVDALIHLDSIQDEYGLIFRLTSYTPFSSLYRAALLNVKEDFLE